MKNYFILIVLIASSYLSFAQVKIGDNPTNIGVSSALELESSNKAFVLTRVANTAAITNPVNGMMVYDLSSQCVKFYENGTWSDCISKGTSALINSILAQIGLEGDAPDVVNSVVTTVQLALLPVTGVVPANQTLYQDYIDANPNLFASPATVAEVQAMINAVNAAITSSGGTALVSAYSCTTASAGTMTEGTAVSGVTQTITATVTTVGTYNISTTANGVTFAATGTFAGTGAQNIVLTATGTPTTAGSNSFTLNTTPNCSFSRTTNPNVAPLPANITLTAGQVHAIASINDDDYLPFTAPAGPANQTFFAAGGGLDPLINVLGTLTTTGVTIQIPYTVTTASVNLPAFSQTVNVPASLTQNNQARNVTLSWAAQTLPVGSGFINATLQAVGGTLEVFQLDLRNGLGDGSENIIVNSTGPVTRSVLGLLLANFTIPLNNVAGNTGQVQMRAITCQNDISTGTGAVAQMMYPYSGTYNTNNYSWCAREVTAAGFTWLDRNLGAYRVATSSTDAQGYGDLFQWGRRNDGHAKRVQRSGQAAEEGNATQGVMVNGTTSTNADVPANALFITETLTPLDWRVNQNGTLWSGVNAVNNPCPTGYRLPTDTELQNLDDSFSPSTSAGAFSSAVKMPMAGYRNDSNGSLNDVGSNGYYWSSTVSGADASGLFFSSGGSNMSTSNRADGFSVRCLKD